MSIPQGNGQRETHPGIMGIQLRQKIRGSGGDAAFKPKEQNSGEHQEKAKPNRELAISQTGAGCTGESRLIVDGKTFTGSEDKKIWPSKVLANSQTGARHVESRPVVDGKPTYRSGDKKTWPSKELASNQVGSEDKKLWPSKVLANN